MSIGGRPAKLKAEQRTERVNLSFNKQEFSKILFKYKLTNPQKSLAVILREVLLDIKVDEKRLKVSTSPQLLGELKRHGNNLNQLVMKANKFGKLTQAERDELKNTLEVLKEVYKRLLE